MGAAVERVVNIEGDTHEATEKAAVGAHEEVHEGVHHHHAAPEEIGPRRLCVYGKKEREGGVCGGGGHR